MFIQIKTYLDAFCSGYISEEQLCAALRIHMKIVELKIGKI